MNAMFVAPGPAFKPGVTMQSFPNVDVYDLLVKLLRLKPVPNDGSIQPFLPVLH